MKIKFSQEELLEKRMTELGLGGAFNNWFLRFPRNNPRLTPYEPAITLKEFFKRNQKFLSCATDRFSCNVNGEGFSLQSASFQKLKRFLIEHGFTQDDWLMLGSRNRQGSLFPFSFNKKSEILTLGFVTWNIIKPRSQAFQLLIQALPKMDVESITAAHILALSQDDIEEVTGTRSFWKLSYDQVQGFRVFITKLQQKFAMCGFTAQDGPFMNISFKKEKLVRNMTYYKRKKLREQYGDNYLKYADVA